MTDISLEARSSSDVKFLRKYVVEPYTKHRRANSNLRCWRCQRVTEIRRSGTHTRRACWKWGSEELVKKSRNLGVSPRRGPWQFGTWLRGLGLTEAGIKVFDELDPNAQRVTTTETRNYERAYLSGDSEGYEGEGYEEVVVSPNFTTLLSLFKSSSTIRASPPVLSLILADEQCYPVQFTKKIILLKY